MMESDRIPPSHLSQQVTQLERCSFRWWQLKYVLFSPRSLGEMIQFDEHIFQMGLVGWIFQIRCSFRLVDETNYDLPTSDMQIPTSTYFIWGTATATRTQQEYNKQLLRKNIRSADNTVVRLEEHVAETEEIRNRTLSCKGWRVESVHLGCQ